MALASGARLGPYEVLTLVGRGGMGEVYRARDTRLGRDVALKVLPDLFAGDPNRRARFEREAQVLASLNHPNIAAILGLEEADGVRALVLEFVEGPTLSEVITRQSASGFRLLAPGFPRAQRDSGTGLKPEAWSPKPDTAPSRRGLPVPEALAIARQIAEALEAAHEHGIIHRDLKPANIKVRADGVVKVLDFGLAKALDRIPSASDLSQAPTVTMPAATRIGAIMGTAAYMSPEQARGQAVDKRADIWAFGCVLYEIMTGKRAFEGENTSLTFAHVMESEPDWTALPEDVPPDIRATLQRCLRKDPKVRLRDIGEARIAIADYLANPGATPAPSASDTRHKLRERFSWGLSGILVAAILTLSMVRFRETPASAPEIRVEINTPPTMNPTSLALSPDGLQLAFVALSEGGPRLWLHSLGNATAKPLAGTEEGRTPFWSPDSRSIGFFAQGKLKRIDVGGGAAQVLADAPTGMGGTWNRDGVIVYTRTATSPLYRISSSGGKPEAITKLDPPRQTSHRMPHFLPNGRSLLFSAGTTRGMTEIHLGSIDSPESRRLLEADSAVAYASGHVLYLRSGTLLAQPFNASKGELSGDPFPLANPVGFYALAGYGAFSASATGGIAYRARGALRQLIWVARSGKELGMVWQPDENELRSPELSPDGLRAAVHRQVQGKTNVWLLDTVRGGISRFTFDGEDSSPIWSPDGSRIVFASGRVGVGEARDLYQRPSSGAGGDELLLESSAVKFPSDWSPDGRFILYMQFDPKTGNDLWVLPMSGERKPFPFVNNEGSQIRGQFSPDGRWVAYESTESGRPEIYLQPFPGPGGKWQVSRSGGHSPRWRRDGKELFLIDSDGKLLAVGIQTKNQAIEASDPVALFQTRIVGGGVGLGAWTRSQYAVAPDGRFLMNVEQPSNTPINLILNWAGPSKK